ASRLRQAIEQHEFRCGAGLSLRITVSIGVAAFPQHGKTAEAVVAAADQALYEAKNSGRNRVVCLDGQSHQKGLPD
ncbi:MAG: GGDEF domain-containing protein, partial [Desulfurivibrionaceae bacterium]